ncbi:MAG: hypothetical protein ACXAEF_13760 [Candidatus Thorarchaeota archaeon]
MFGTFGWGGGGVKKLKQQLENAKYEIMEPVVRVRGKAREEEQDQLKELAKNIAEILK